MKSAFYFAYHELFRRRGRTLSLIIMSAAIICALNMLLFHLEADWRNKVMPDNPQNYHFSVVTDNKTYEIREYILSSPWVQTYYETDFYDSNNIYKETTFSIRVDWENNLNAITKCYQMFEDLDLWSEKRYVSMVDSLYTSNLSNLKREYFGAEIINGLSLSQIAMSRAKTQTLYSLARNSGFCRLAVNNYIMRPEFIAYISAFSIYLCASAMIVFFLQYRGDMHYYGALRAIGMKRRNLMLINAIKNVIISLLAIPLSTLLTAAVVYGYNAATASLDDGTVYLNLGKYLPIGAMAIVAVIMVLSNLAGCLLVCTYFKNRNVMELIRGDNVTAVSFVSKTSSLFESAQKFGIYSRLQLYRTRLNVLLNSAVISMMIPLPMMFLLNSYGFIMSKSPILTVIYHLLQSTILALSSALIIFVNVRSSCYMRDRELAILRSLGVVKKSLLKVVLYPRIVEAIMAMLFSIIFFMIFSPSSSGFNLLICYIVEVLVSVLIIFIPTLCGCFKAVIHFYKRSTIYSLQSLD